MGSVTYYHFDKAFKELLHTNKQQMLTYENKQTFDYRYTDITLKKISTCADSLIPSYFWAGFTLEYSLIDIKTGLEAEPIENRYYIKTGSSKISLMNDFLEQPFSEVWNLPEELEEGLIKSLLADVIEEYQMCFQELTNSAFELLIEQGFINYNQFDEKSKLKYYELHGIDSLLPKSVRDIFVF